MNPMSSEREAATRRVMAAATPDEAQRIYDNEYFPLALAAMSDESKPCRLLVLTVGTQPYSIALSLRRSPAETVCFIHTDESRSSAESGIARAKLDPSPKVHYRRVEMADSVAVYEAIRDVAQEEVGDLSDPLQCAGITINFSSGTKAMTAAASAVAGLFNIRQVYIGSELLKFRLYGREVAHEVDHPFVALGDPKRIEAESAFHGGLFDLAEGLFQELERARVPGYAFSARVALCQGYRALEALRFTQAANKLRESAALLQGAVSSNVRKEGLRTSSERLANQASAVEQLASVTSKGARVADDQSLSNLLTRFLLATARRRLPREPDLAALLFYRTLELSLQRRLASHGIDASQVRESASDGAALLAAYNECSASKVSELPDPAGLSESRWLLVALRDQVVLELDKAIPFKKFQGLLESRNKSIFAHGFKTLDANDLLPFQKVVLAYAEAVAQADELSLPVPDLLFDLIRFD